MSRLSIGYATPELLNPTSDKTETLREVLGELRSIDSFRVGAGYALRRNGSMYELVVLSLALEGDFPDVKYSTERIFQEFGIPDVLDKPQGRLSKAFRNLLGMGEQQEMPILFV